MFHDVHNEYVINIVNDFATEFEIFDKALTSEKLTLNDECNIITNTADWSYGLTGFGANIATKGKKYHWRVKIDKYENGDDPRMNIGIIEAHKAKNYLSTGWWIKPFGYILQMDTFIMVQLMLQSMEKHMHLVI